MLRYRVNISWSSDDDAFIAEVPELPGCAAHGLTPAAARPVAVIPVGEAAEGPALDAAQALRRAGVAAEIGYKGNLKRRMERANRSGARIAVIIGEAELEAGTAQVRDLDAGTQEQVPLADLPDRLAP